MNGPDMAAFDHRRLRPALRRVRMQQAMHGNPRAEKEEDWGLDHYAIVPDFTMPVSEAYVVWLCKAICPECGNKVTLNIPDRRDYDGKTRDTWFTMKCKHCKGYIRYFVFYYDNKDPKIVDITSVDHLGLSVDEGDAGRFFEPVDD